MKTLTRGVVKFFISNLVVVSIIAMLPVFLLTDDIPLFNQMINYLFGNES